MTLPSRVDATAANDEANDLGAVLDGVLDAAITLAEADCGGIQVLDPDGSLRLVVHRGFPDWWIAYWSNVGAGEGASGSALATGDRVIVEDVEHSPVYFRTQGRRSMRDAGVRTVQSTPIRGRSGRILGMLSTHYRTPRRLEGRILEVLDLLADHAATLIERTFADRKIRKLESEYRAAIESTADGFWIVDESGRLLTVNDRYVEQSGYSREELLGMRVDELDARHDASALRMHRENLRLRRSVLFETMHRRKSGALWPVEVNAAHHPEAGDRFFVFLRDITERRRAEQARRQSEERLNLFIEHAPAALAMFDRDMRYLAASRRWREDFGLGDTRCIGLDHYALFPEIPEAWRQVHRRALAGETIESEEDRFLRSDGRVQYLRWKVLPWSEADDRVGGILILSEDITDRVQAEDALRKSESMLRQAQEAARTGTWEWDVVNNRNRWSDETFRLYGWEPGSVVPSYDKWLASIRPEDREAADAIVRDCLDRATEMNLEWRAASDDRWLMCRGQPRFDSDGRVIAYLGVVIDVTERKLAERALEGAREKLAEAQRVAHMGSFEHDLANDTTTWSEEQYRIHGLDPAEPAPNLERILARFIHPDEAPTMRREFVACMSGGRMFDREHRIIRPDGEVRWARTRALAYLDERGNPCRWLGTTLDITELRRARELARARMEDAARLQRLHTANELASVLAHELNQPLGAITVYAEVCRRLLRQPASDGDELGGALDHIVQQATRAGEIIHHMRRFVSRGEMVSEAMDLNAVIRGVDELLEPSAHGKGVRVSLDLAPDLPPVMGVEVQIEQVLLNLLRNAFEAIAEQGSGSGEVGIRSCQSGDMVRVTVSDSGPGVSPEEASRLFETASSRKPNGLGLGLRISRGLVEAHGGRLWAEPQAPGAVFHFELPQA